MVLKGVVLAGGSGTRLAPLTDVTNKHLLPVWDRPMIHYPLETLREMGVDEVLVILGGRSVGEIVELLQDGADLGLNISYRYQPAARGIAHAIGLAREFVGADPVCIVLGDNVLLESLAPAARAFVESDAMGGAVLTRVPDPHRFGVAAFDAAGSLIGFDEKPAQPASDLIPIGVYYFRPSVFDVIESLEPSARGEFEITDLLNHFLSAGTLTYVEYRGSWADAGTIEALLEASTLARDHASKSPRP
jgi:glucose-1-phosphate thymidylyltransferase